MQPAGDRDLASARVHEQCEYETKLASRLRRASQPERLRLYGELYDEYARRFPEALPSDEAQPMRIARFETAFLRRFLTPASVVAEIGVGRCHLAFSLAKHVAQVIGIDVSEVTARNDATPRNFRLVISDGIHLPLPDASVDLVMSNQLMEHLHPEDAADQLREVFRILRRGGRYVCITPSRVNGPHDSSARFADLPCPIVRGSYAAVGLHLKEYTSSELVDVFRGAGFHRVETWVGLRGKYARLPNTVLAAIEAGVSLVPARMRKRSKLLAPLLGNRVVAVK